MFYRSSSARRARGFTLIELILVIGIILVLLALIIGAAMRGTAWVSQGNTERTFTKVTQRLNRHYATIAQDAKAWETPDAILTQANGDVQRAEVLKIKYLYKWSFPINFVEVEENYQQSLALYGRGGYQMATALYTKLKQGQENATLPLRATTLNAAQQNSACLLAIFQLTKGSSQDEFAPTELDQQNPNFNPPANTTRDNNKWLIDAWGSPVIYIRNANLEPALLSAQLGGAGQVPYNVVLQNWLLLKAQSACQHKQGIDAEDPNGLLRKADWSNFANGAAWNMFPPITPVIPNPTINRNCFRFRFYHDPNPAAANYAPLVIFSAGPDRNFDTVYDNIESYGLKLTVGDTN
jgi:prepilin-type N-terminal cleavage/methylation domain-containing protein